MMRKDVNESVGFFAIGEMGLGGDDCEHDIEDEERTGADDESDDGPQQSIFAFGFLSAPCTDGELIAGEDDIEDEEDTHEAEDDFNKVSDEEWDACWYKFSRRKIAVDCSTGAHNQKIFDNTR